MSLAARVPAANRKARNGDGKEPGKAPSTWRAPGALASSGINQMPPPQRPAQASYSRLRVEEDREAKEDPVIMTVANSTPKISPFKFLLCDLPPGTPARQEAACIPPKLKSMQSRFPALAIYEEAPLSKQQHNRERKYLLPGVRACRKQKAGEGDGERERAQSRHTKVSHTVTGCWEG